MMKQQERSQLWHVLFVSVATSLALLLLSSASGRPGASSAARSANPPSAQEGSASYLFADEFDGTALDTNAWVALDRPGDASNSEIQCYLPSNAAVASGLLTLTSKVDSSCAGYRYTSAMVQWRSFKFLYGTIEVRAKLAGGTTWPAIWLLGADCQQTNVLSADNIPPCNWPYPGSDEIDIAEVMGGNRTSINQQIHSSLGKPRCSASTSDVSLNWHTYTLVWEAGRLTFQIDGTTTCVLTEAVPSHPMFLMINTALGGHGGPVAPATLPQNSAVDYVRVSPTTSTQSLHATGY
jgi:beta-glucanase (GH16 family)